MSSSTTSGRLAQPVQLLEDHAAVEGVEPVVGEIDAGGVVEQLHDLGEVRLAILIPIPRAARPGPP